MHRLFAVEQVLSTSFLMKSVKHVFGMTYKGRSIQIYRLHILLIASNPTQRVEAKTAHVN